MSESLVSVCIPTYNGETYIRESLMSVICQTYQKIEIIVVDDCSTDDTVSIIEEFVEKYNNIRLFRNEVNLGLVENWNRCIDLSEGEWIKFHFQDDLMKPECLSTFFNYVDSSKHRLVLCNRKYFYVDSNAEARKSFYEDELPRLADVTRFLSREEVCKIYLDNVLGLNFLGEPIAGIFKKEIVQKYGYFDKHMRQICDFEFWLRIAINEGVMFVNEKMVSFRVHSKSTTAKNHTNVFSFYHLDRIYMAFATMNFKHYKGIRDYCAIKGISYEMLLSFQLEKLLRSISWKSFKRLFQSDYRFSYFFKYYLILKFVKQRAKIYATSLFSSRYV